MIAKRSARRTDGKSSYGSLAKYICDEKHGGEKVEHSRITNCMSDDPELAIKEIEATQSLNTRSKADKSYHLILSFRSGEHPTPEQLEDIEHQFCKGLGFSEHQRMSAVHNDTDNLHIHIAINKVHPQTYRNVEPYYDHYKLSELCKEMEIKHNLQIDNHIDSQSIQGKAADMEAHSGKESFKSWIKENAAEELTSLLTNEAPDWQQLHTRLAKYNLQIKPRGTGLIIAHKEKQLYVKASDISRQLSKGNLQKKLGEFQPHVGWVEQSDTQHQPQQAQPPENPKEPAPEQTYNEPPLQPKTLTSDLWDEYQKQRNALIVTRKEAFAALKEEKETRYNSLKETYAQRRAEIKTDVIIRKREKRNLYKTMADHRKASYNSIKKEMAEKREQVYQANRQQSWQEFLISKSINGNEEALEALRKSKRKPDRSAGNNQFTGQTDNPHHIYSNIPHSVRKNGDVVYQLDKTGRLRDDGTQLKFEQGQDQALHKSLQIAQQKYGNKLTINGSSEFKSRAIRIAAEAGMNIEFADQAMEQTRQTLTKRFRQPSPKHQNTAITQYIKDRNQQAEASKDIPFHRVFTKSDNGTLKYGGIRNIGNNKKVVIYLYNKEALVMPVTDYQANKLKRIKVGTEINVNSRGQVWTPKQKQQKGMER